VVYHDKEVKDYCLIQLTLDSVLHGNMKADRAGVSRDHISSSMQNEGPNSEKEKGPLVTVVNPNGGAARWRVNDKPDPETSITRLRPSSL